MRLASVIKEVVFRKVNSEKEGNNFLLRLFFIYVSIIIKARCVKSASH